MLGGEASDVQIFSARESQQDGNARELNAEPGKDIYSRVQLCETLEAGMKCCRILKFKRGKYALAFHLHFRKHRISAANAIAMMRTLMAKHRALDDESIVRGYLNDRGNEPMAMPIGTVHVEFPEPGVLRKYLSHGDTSVLLDEVISSDRFRI